ncbi:hypothetical protein L1987_08655 [Smallanthus sonchifolius]|uniref:Uncharacterized protein n=1 Tax=Smallanthus sonchifolius TaxID=185202 RepID=A0ACB9JMC7_9ASTR|nr:hypothetical protein L1987_08655 [Smallanthus sonchifolius]
MNRVSSMAGNGNSTPSSLRESVTATIYHRRRVWFSPWRNPRHLQKLRLLLKNRLLSEVTKSFTTSTVHNFTGSVQDCCLIPESPLYLEGQESHLQEKEADHGINHDYIAVELKLYASWLLQSHLQDNESLHNSSVLTVFYHKLGEGSNIAHLQSVEGVKYLIVVLLLGIVLCLSRLRHLPELSKRNPHALEVEGCQSVAQSAKRVSIVAAPARAASVRQLRGTLSVSASALPCSFPTPCFAYR